MKKDLSDEWEERWTPSGWTANWKDAVMIGSMYESILHSHLNARYYQTFLDVGAGSGKWSAGFTLMGLHCTVVDIYPDMLRQIQINFPVLSNAMTFVNDDARTLNKIPNKFYDFVFSEGLIEHFLDEKMRRQVIIKMATKLKQKGKLITGVPAHKSEDESPEDEHYYGSLNALLTEMSTYELFNKITGVEFINALTREPKIYFAIGSLPEH